MRLTGWGDPFLNEIGQQQALAVRDKLLTEFPQIDAIHSSPLTRAIQTATPLLEALQLPLTTHPDLKEYYFGEVEGMTFSEVQEKYGDLFKNWRSPDEPQFAWPGGETRMVFHTRVDQAIWNIIQTEAGQHKTVAIFGHGGALAGFIAELETGQPYLWRQFLLDNCEFYVVEVHFPTTPVTRENCTLQVAYKGKILPVSKFG